MGWNSDNFGIVFSSREIKLYKDGSHSWGMKLSQLARQKGVVRIVTYSIPDLDFASEQLGRRPGSMFLICHSKFSNQAVRMKLAFSGVRIAVNDRVHSKICLIEPRTIYIGSANFGRSNWHETLIGVRSKTAHDWYVEHSFLPLWHDSRELLSNDSHSPELAL